MRYQFIRAEKTNYPFWLLCQVMEVSMPGYYSWLKRGEGTGRDYNEIDRAIAEIHTENDRNYGTRRQQKALAKQGHHLSRKTVRKRMDEQELEDFVAGDLASLFEPSAILPRRTMTPNSPLICWVGSFSRTSPTKRG